MIGRKALTVGQIAKDLDLGGVTLRVQTIDHRDAEAIRVLGAAEDTKTMKERVSLLGLENPRAHLLAYCAAVLLLAGKQLSEVSAKSGRRGGLLAWQRVPGRPSTPAAWFP